MSTAAENVLKTLRNTADAARAGKITTQFGEVDSLGTAPQEIEDMARALRQDMSAPELLTLARDLWASDIHEARILAAKLLTQARIKDDAEIWDQITAWIAEARNWAELDALAAAGARRVVTDLSRMEAVHTLAGSERVLDRRAALGLSLPLAKLANPTEDEVHATDDVLFWLTHALEDTDKDVSRMADSWLKSLGKHDRKRASMVRRVVNSRKSDD